MTVPKVTPKKIDGGLGITVGAAGNAYVVAGPSSKGTKNTPKAYTRSSDVVTDFGYGPMPEFACYAIESYGQTVVCVRTDATTVGALGTVVSSSWTGGAVTADVTCSPNDDYEWGLKITTGAATLASSKVQWTLDGGRNYSADTTPTTTFTIPNSGIVLDIVEHATTTGDTVTGTSTAPACASPDLTAATAAMTNYAGGWEFLVLASPVDTTISAVLDTWIASMLGMGKFHWWLASAAIPATGVADSTYQASLLGFASYSSVSGSVTAGAARTVSAIPARSYNYIRPVSLSVAPLILSVSEEVRISQRKGTILPGVSLTDSNNNLAPRCHDEFLQPGLDDLRFLSLRSWPGDQGGVRCNRPKMFGATGSDFDMINKIRTWNLWAKGAYEFFMNVLQVPVLADPRTGYILESFAKALEVAVNQKLDNLMCSKPKASAQLITISRTDPLVNTANPNLTVDGRMVPLGYFDFVTLNQAFAPSLFTFPVTVA